MGAWIETLINAGCGFVLEVAPFMGAWIETFGGIGISTYQASRTLYGCVD